MAAFGDLAPFGLLAFGAKPTDAERLYAAMRAAVRGLNTGMESHAEASAYARALGIAACRAVLQHARDQRRASRVVEMLPAQERWYGLSPLPGDSLDTRRAGLAARKLTSRGSRAEALLSLLTALFGSQYLGIRTLAVPSEAPLESTAAGLWTDPRLPMRSWRLLGGVPSPAVPFTVAYEALGFDDGTRIEAGDRLSCDAGNWGRAEVITVTAVNNTANPPTLTATFAKAHDPGAPLMTHAPLLLGRRRTLLLLLDAAALSSLSRIREGFEALHRVVRATTQPHLVLQTGPMESGPFQVGISPVGLTTLGVVTGY